MGTMTMARKWIECCNDAAGFTRHRPGILPAKNPSSTSSHLDPWSRKKQTAKRRKIHRDQRILKDHGSTKTPQLPKQILKTT